ncbi:MAG: carboxypeptidase-like regulatory domain-containing protein [Leadbetterella sp.]|nr:carboxypeptidase-like regulatory domain-containing protein [Leadbetterella sp.]
MKDSQGGLPGAVVKLEGTSYVSGTDAEGTFVISGTLSGSYNLTITYIGYQPYSKSLTVTGSTDLGDILLVTDSNLLGEVVVTSVYRPSQARALSMRKIAPNIVEVLAADAIGKLPDRNAAEAVQRMQGVSIERDMGEGRFVSVRGTPIQWSASTLNGNRLPSASGDNANRGLQMDIFPSELIQYVKLAKAITPDMDGDAIGGSVDFITKTTVKKRNLCG